MGHIHIVWKIIIDLVVLLLVAVPLLVLSFWVEPFHRGYFEDDTSLRLPYKPQTVSEGVLAGVGFALIIVTILITEAVRAKNDSNPSEYFLCDIFIPSWVWQSYINIGVYTFGAACQQLAVNAAKYVIGRLRPHFFDVCQPIPTNSSANALGYIQDFSCAGTDQARIKDMRLSFPSAHSGFAMYTALFFIFYIQGKLTWQGSKLCRHALQFLVMMAAWFVGLSRVQDHMHHWGDVAVGFGVGAVFAVLVSVFVLKVKKFKPSRSWLEPPNNLLPRPVMERRE